MLTAARLFALAIVLPVAALAQGSATAYGSGCPVPGPVALGFAPNPGAGQLQLFETGIPSTVLPIACLGTSSTQWGPLALPFALDGLGLSGCNVLAEPLVLTTTTLPANGVAEHTLPVPGSAALTGAALFGQWLNAGDPSVSTALPLTLSNAVAFTLGNQVGMPGFVLYGDPTAPAGATWTYVATIGGVSYDLTGRLYKPATPPAGGHSMYPGVIISHGFGGNANGYSAAIASTMRTWGLVCIMTNLTHAAGVPLGSPGLATERGASAANVLRNRKCIDLLQSLGYVDMRRLAAHGHSMGAFATGALLGTHPQSFLVGSHTAGGMSTQAGAATTTLAQAQGIVAPLPAPPRRRGHRRAARAGPGAREPARRESDRARAARPSGLHARADQPRRRHARDRSRLVHAARPAAVARRALRDPAAVVTCLVATSAQQGHTDEASVLK